MPTSPPISWFNSPFTFHALFNPGTVSFSIISDTSGRHSHGNSEGETSRDEDSSFRGM